MPNVREEELEQNTSVTKKATLPKTREEELGPNTLNSIVDQTREEELRQNASTLQYRLTMHHLDKIRFLFHAVRDGTLKICTSLAHYFSSMRSLKKVGSLLKRDL